MRTLRYHDPFAAFHWLRCELDRVFEAGLPGPAAQLPLNVLERETEYEVVAPLAGADPERLDVSLDGDVLRIAGERVSATSDGARRFASERPTGPFERKIRLPAHIAADSVRAEYKDGVLRITLAKDETARPRTIPVSVN